ncbi:MAG TPA: hypothetical protein PLK29_02805 [Chiayiivirga sp.]|nr:hypothetical protein [Chiayiivirga sp.]
MPRPILFLLLALLLLAEAPAGHAATWCVRNHTELQQALTAAAASPGDDEIRVREGIYTTFAGTFTYNAQTTGWMWITGGWYTVDGNDCAQMRMDASRTVLDGAGQSRVLQIILMPPAGTTQAARLGVMNLTIANGYGDSATYQRGGGIQMNSYSDGYTELWLDRVIVANSDGYFGGGAELYAKNGFVRVANSLFDNNDASASAFGHAAINVVATAASVSPAIIIANSTFARGRCAGDGTRGCGIGVGLPAGVHLAVLNSLFHDNALSDLNIEGMAVIGLGNGSAAADYSLIPTLSGNLPLAATHAFTGDPMFVDPVNGNFRLRDASPLIDRGLAPLPYYPLGGSDLDAQPRVRFGAVDPGPYENQTRPWLFIDGFEP